MAAGPLHISLLLLATHSVCVATGRMYRWTDEQGQVHFSDIAPLRTESTEIMLEPSHTPGGNGLRPGEVATLLHIQQRTIRQRTLTQASRRRLDRQSAARRKDCEDHRNKFHQARDPHSYKKHAKYLQKNCW